MSVEPFRIETPEATLEDLRARLAATRWTEQTSDERWELGTDVDWLRELCEHWRTEHDWGAPEERFNAHENLRWNGLHVTKLAADGDRVPVVLLHGWPSGPIEYLTVAEQLAKAGHTALVPSLPGFGFSEAPAEPLDIRGTAARLHALITEGLGHERYVVAGGDWGAPIAARMAQDAPGAVHGLYVTTPGVLPVPGALRDLSEA